MRLVEDLQWPAVQSVEIQREEREKIDLGSCGKHSITEDDGSVHYLQTTTPVQHFSPGMPD